MSRAIIPLIVCSTRTHNVSSLSSSSCLAWVISLNEMDRSKCDFSLGALTNFQMINKLYTIISNKLWDLSLYFGDLYNRWVLASQQKALGPCKCTRFRVMQTYRNYSFSYFDALLPQKRLILSLLMRTISSPEIFTKKCQQQQNFDSDPKEAWHYNNVTFTPIAKNFMLYCRLIYMLSMLYVRLTIKVKVGIPESFKVGWYPHKITGSSHLKFFFLGEKNFHKSAKMLRLS